MASISLSNRSKASIAQEEAGSKADCYHYVTAMKGKFSTTLRVQDGEQLARLQNHN